jgi:hypothetical protein
MIIPDKNLFIVTSSLKPAIGAFSDEDRFTQTLATLKSIREKLPEAIVVLSDISIRPLTDMEREVLQRNCHFMFDLSQDQNTNYCSINGLKSHAENCMLYAVLMELKNNPSFGKLMASVKRIFKFSARSELEDGFDMKEYDGLFGKYVFKKRIHTWMGQPKMGADHLFITRMFSLCPSLINDYLMVIQKNLNCLANGLDDTEHAHFVNISKDHLVEFDRLHMWGWLAGNGQIEHY